MNSNRVPRIKLALLAVVLLCGGLRAAADPVQEVTTGIKPEKKSFFSMVDLSASYTLVTDFNQDVSPHTYYHNFDFTASRELWGDYVGAITAGFQFVTLDNAVTRDNKDDDYFKFNDVNLNMLRTFRFLDGKQNLTIIGDEDVLLSEDSRYLGYYSVTYAQAVATTHVAKWLALKNSVMGGYIANRFRYSPIAYDQMKIGDINPDGFYAYSLTPLFRILPGLNLSASLTVRGTHYLDDSNLYDFGNSYMLSYAHDNWSVYLKYINKGWTDRGETNLWFVDEYRRLAELGVMADF